MDAQDFAGADVAYRQAAAVLVRYFDVLRPGFAREYDACTRRYAQLHEEAQKSFDWES